MTPGIVKTELKAAVCLAAAVALFTAGFIVEGWRKDAQLAELQGQIAHDKQKAAEANTRQITRAQAIANDLQGRLAASESARQSILEEKTLELRRITTGRPCLGGAAVRLLNLPDGLKPGAVSAAARESVPADAGFASDTDVAEWAGACRRSYDTCRGRLAAIADFYAGVRDE